VKAKALLLLVSFACASTACLFGQVDCTTSKKLVCEFPVSASTLAANTVGNVQGLSPTVFELSETAARPFNSSIATQLTQLPVPSAAIGTVFFKQKGKDAPVSFENLGPILTDRPDTVGKNHLFVGFSYQHFNFNSLDGVSMGRLPAGFTFSQASATNPLDTLTFYGAEGNNVGFKLNQYVGVLTYGLTKNTDVSVVVPINSVSLTATVTNFQAYEYDSASRTYTNLSPAAGTSAYLTGTASGIGDVTINFKQLLIGGEGRPAIAGGVMLRIPSGDALSYLGSGAVGGNAYGLFEYRKRLAPHLKLSYQWNGNSQVMNLQVAPNTRLPGGLQYAAGAAAGGCWWSYIDNLRDGVYQHLHDNQSQWGPEGVPRQGLSSLRERPEAGEQRGLAERCCPIGRDCVQKVASSKGRLECRQHLVLAFNSSRTLANRSPPSLS